jgi:type II secretory pathway component PulF
LAEWVYKAIAPDGAVVSGVEKANSEEQLQEMLQARGSFLLKSKSKAAVMSASSHGKKIKPQSLIDFSNQLAMLFKSGVPLVAGLGDLVNEMDDPVLKNALGDVHDRISHGETLSSSLARYPLIFTDDYVQIVIAGEESGELATSLERLAESIEWRVETARRFKSAFAYPAVLSVAVLGLMTLIVTWLVPRLSQIFIDAGVELPTITLATLAVADFLKSNSNAIFGAFVALIIAVVVMRNTHRGRFCLHGILLKLPLAGPLALMMEAARFSNSLGLLLNSGVSLVRSLEISRDATRNLVMKKNVNEIHRSVLRGKPLADSLRAVDCFPSLVLRMVSIGEQSGSMVESLNRVASFFDKEIPRRIKKFLAILEPSITIVMGVGVCFAVLSAFLPMTKLLGAIKG